MATKTRKQGTNFIARNLQWSMAQEGITQQALADATGVGQPTINRILTGRNLKPRDVTLHPLARHFDVTIEDLKSTDLSQGSGLLSTLRGTKIPMVSSKIAGKQRIRPDHPDRITVYCRVSSEAFAMDISDGGMEPRFHRGDRVVVEPTMLPAPGHMVAALVDGGDAIVRKYKALEATNPKAKRDFELVPLHEDFARFSSRTSDIKILGVCVERHESLIET